MRTGAASAVGVRRHNENDVTTIAGLWRYGGWRHVATGCIALVRMKVHPVAAYHLWWSARLGLSRQWGSAT